jgi:hypothetical protein
MELGLEKFSSLSHAYAFFGVVGYSQFPKGRMVA